MIPAGRVQAAAQAAMASARVGAAALTAALFALLSSQVRRMSAVLIVCAPHPL